MKKNVPNLKLTELLDSVSVIVITCDEQGNVTYLSPETSKISGYKTEQLLGLAWWDLTFFSKEEGQFFKEKVIKLLSGEANVDPIPYERKIRCLDGSYKWIEWRDSLSQNNNYVSVGVDITNWKIAKELKINSDVILKNVESMVFVSDKDGNVIYASPSVEKMLGFKVEEIMGDNWWNLTYDTIEEATKVKKAIHDYVFFNTKDFTDISKRKIKTKSGNYKWIEWQVSKGTDESYISIGTDITNRISTELELKKAKETAEKSLKVKTEFLANMSHEIRTPLNAIIGFTDLLLETQLNHEQKEHLETMRNSGDILLSLINNVLDLSKLESDKILVENIDFDLHKNLYEVVKLMKIRADEKGILLNLLIEDNVTRNVIGDPTRLGQILLNLIGNAIKFTNEGSVLLMVKLVDEKQSNVKIYFEVRDTGIGILSNKINTVFGVFTQAKSDTSRIYGGTGLGLAIVKKLVILLKGDIKAESVFGEGSVFRMTLPFIKSVKSFGELKLDKIGEISENLNLYVLLVDDNITNQIVAKTRLERWSCKVDVANNGIEAVKMAQINNYDIILMDIQMPVMDGYEASKIIKNDISEKAAKIPIIAMTAYTSSEDIKRAKDAGMIDYVFKPFRPKDLFLKLLEHSKVPLSETLVESKKVKTPFISFNHTKFVDLKFIKEETSDESSIVILLIQSFLNDIDEFLKVTKFGVKERNWELLYNAAHKIKPSVSMFGIALLEPTIYNIEQNFKNEHDVIKGVELLKSSILIFKKVKNELENELNILKNG
ncbi:PAS domain-containing hybrid sensor histidine kinase/response regulator [Lutibacter sp.]|uniref:PAS domain-containing hybrid sensor histidine kinase/response regulator n=1 Tax=Lutibacter sp. TaxID=1925666 RepID=UPI0027374E53|nr:PAS domain S-box protein [Lutibacter sp.]MDP3312700.1 PAS domain S-box protein [Lutibacter sp.]